MKENSIEEDIKILKELRIANENCIENAKIKDNPFVAIWEKQNRAIEHILSDYKRVLKENELLSKDIESWNKYCEEIEEERIEMSNKNCELEFEVEKLQKENEELKADNYELNNRITDLLENIPDQKVKDKIEELKQEKKKYGNCLIEMYEDELVNRDIKILQELLESEE